MKYFKYIILVFGILLFSHCSDYLNVVPDGTATLENAFSNRTNSERFFYGCYNYLPNFAHPFNYPGYAAGADEIWWDMDNGTLYNRNGARIAQGQQNITGPYLNYWDGANDGKRMWIGIRDCNIFLANIDNVPDLQEWERVRWKAEVKFLKAYFHFFMLQMYGPIPIMDENIEVSASPEEVRVFREPVDDVIEYVVNLLDEAKEDLPLRIEDRTTESGRATQAIALAVKAKALVWAASPLFNGSYAFYHDFKDKRGVQLITNNSNAENIRARWQRAAVAAKNAIDTAHLSGHGMFSFNRGFDVMSDTTALKYTLRGAVTERMTYNREIIWACTNANNEFQNWCTPKVYSNDGGGIAELSATLKMAETYYTRNGIPIDEDPYWEYDLRYETRADTGEWHKYYIGAGEITAKLNFYREPRFYAHLGFDRGIYELLANSDETALVIKQKSGEAHGMILQDNHISTGYFIKKAVSFRIPTNSATPAPYRFSIPIIRLPDLYLLYAEALNESKETPDAEVYRWVDSVRIRAGLNTVVESWRWAKPEYQDKPYRKDGMREIIKRERLIELSFEGHRPFDLRRWLDAEKYMNEPVRGWDYQGVKLEDYYQTRVYFNNRRFTYKDYLWPLRNSTIIVNSNLVQNPGW
jgi:hypothetical protein